MSILTLKGFLHNGVFDTEDGIRIQYIVCKNFKYDSGNVYAQFTVDNRNFILINTVPA